MRWAGNRFEWYDVGDVGDSRSGEMYSGAPCSTMCGTIGGTIFDAFHRVCRTKVFGDALFYNMRMNLYIVTI